jgi:protein O-GlcNAc transferase
MGVPVVSMAGQRHMGRVGVSLLTRAGLGELVAASPEAYLDLAAALAADLARCAALRAGMRERLAAGPLTDAPRLTRALEAAYREMWREWCAR